MWNCQNLRDRPVASSLYFRREISLAIRGFGALSIPVQIVRHKSKFSARIGRRSEMLLSSHAIWPWVGGQPAMAPNGARQLCSRGGAGGLFWHMEVCFHVRFVLVVWLWWGSLPRPAPRRSWPGDRASQAPAFSRPRPSPKAPLRLATHRFPGAHLAHRLFC